MLFCLGVRATSLLVVWYGLGAWVVDGRLDGHGEGWCSLAGWLASCCWMRVEEREVGLGVTVLDLVSESRWSCCLR
jgi:hypothetical protein